MAYLNIPSHVHPYCLHKDTDTTVSRLHSNGKPGRSFVLSGEDIAKCYGGVSDQVKIEGLEKTVKETVEKMSESIIKPHIHAR